LRRPFSNAVPTLRNVPWAHPPLPCLQLAAGATDRTIGEPAALCYKLLAEKKYDQRKHTHRESNYDSDEEDPKCD